MRAQGGGAGGLMTGAVKLMAYAVGVEAQQCSLCFCRDVLDRKEARFVN